MGADIAAAEASDATPLPMRPIAVLIDQYSIFIYMHICGSRFCYFNLIYLATRQRGAHFTLSSFEKINRMLRLAASDRG
jgi:hypothetical protein